MNRTKTDRIRQNDEKSKLSARQVKFLPVLLASPTYTEACRKGRVSRDTLYEWLRDPAFKAEVERQRAVLVAEAFAQLSQSVGKAVEALVALLETGDDRLKRLTAKDILDQHLKFKEMDDLVTRIERIERQLEGRA